MEEVLANSFLPSKNTFIFSKQSQANEQRKREEPKLGYVLTTGEGFCLWGCPSEEGHWMGWPLLPSDYL